MTFCLMHQLEEDQATPLGFVCPCCKHHLYTQLPSGRCRAFWESQPGAYSLDRQPMFVFSIMWDDFRIRSLHPIGSEEDERGERVREYERLRLEQEQPIPPVSAEFQPLDDDFGSLEISHEADLWGSDDSPLDSSEESPDEDERWLDLPNTESWLDISWQPESEDSDG